MKAVVWTKYGSPDVLQLQDIEKPTPGDNDVLIKVRAATVTAGDCEVRAMKLPMGMGIPMRLYTGIRRPNRIRILGQEVAGEIEVVGKNVTTVKPGDAVFGSTGFHFGAYAEYLCLPAEFDDGVLAIKPDNISFEGAAGIITGGFESLHFLRQASIQPGQSVLINGAGGSIGTAGIQLANYYGAEVTAVDSGEKLDMLRSLGASDVIDYTQEDFAQRAERYDVVFDVVGRRSFARCVKVLKPEGIYLLANPTFSSMLRGLWVRTRTDKRIIFNFAGRETDDLLFLKELIEAGHLKTIIDRTFPLEETADAHRYVETGRKAGNVIITVGQ